MVTSQGWAARARAGAIVCAVIAGSAACDRAGASAPATDSKGGVGSAGAKRAELESQLASATARASAAPAMEARPSPASPSEAYAPGPNGQLPVAQSAPIEPGKGRLAEPNLATAANGPVVAATSPTRAKALPASGNGQLQDLSGGMGYGGGAATSGYLGHAVGARLVAPPLAPPVEQALAVAQPHLDPNARYATTYRPGGAALAAFDAAVSRGAVPGTYRDLVGDFAAPYAPALAAPEDGALAIAVDTERAAAGPQGGPMNLRVALASSDAMPPRAPLSVHIVLDISGSMSGKAIEDAKGAAEAAVGKLEPTDDFSMVTFSNTAQLLVTDGPIGPRRAQVLAKIEGVKAEGGTNISSGLDLGYAEARQAAAAPGADEAVRIVMLLSDGHANAGDTDPASLADRAARAFQDGVQTSSFGLGPDFDASLMSRIADRGAGGYYYLADSSQIQSALGREIDARLRPVATAIELRVRLRPDVTATRVYGSRELTAVEASAVRAQEVAVDQHEQRRGIAGDRQTDAAGGMRFFIPAFARSDRHAQMIGLQLPPGVGERSIASVEVRYKDRLLKKNVTRELAVHMRWAPSDPESAATMNPSVQRMAQAFAAGEAILQAADDVVRGDRGGARRLLTERAEVLRAAATTLAEPRLADDAARLERLANAVGGQDAMADALPLVVMLRGSGYGYL